MVDKDGVPIQRTAPTSAPSSAGLPRTVTADGDHVASTRLRFLTSEEFETSTVRDTILASWWRSRSLEVAADRIELPYLGDPEPDTPLVRSAEPVLRRLRDQLAGQPISVILTDQSGLVLSQRSGDGELGGYLDGVHLVPGFSYAEQFVGTNGIGTALEGGRAMHVFGHEHYAEHLERLACAGVPIRHPVTGKVIGALDLTCWRKDAGQLLIALAHSTAEQIQQQLLANTSGRELAVFQAYLRTCSRSNGIVLAVSDDLVMMNDYARQLLDPADQTALLGHAAIALADGRSGVEPIDLPTGGRARMQYRAVAGSTGTAGGVLQVKLIGGTGDRASVEGPVLRMFLPGLVGSGALWLRSCHEVDRSCGAGEWVALSGEPGTGKLALALGVHRRRSPSGIQHVLDAAEAAADGAGWLVTARRELTGQQTGSVVLRHVDVLDDETATGLTEVLRDLLTGAAALPWVVATVTADRAVSPAVDGLLALFPSTVMVPPLRHHAEDIRELVPYFLAKLSQGGQLSCSPQAMQLLMRSDWRGNTGQLYRVLSQITRRRRRMGVIRSDDLPAECRTVHRRKLNPLESMERDAIVQSLQDSGGNKGRAAKLLGMSRATIYRKIHEYGIIPPGS